MFFSGISISIGYKDVVDRFNADYEGVYHVTPVTTNLEEYYTKLNALVASGQTPDVFIVSPGPNLDVYVEPGITADLTDYLKQDGWIDTFNGGEGAFSQQTYDGKIYAIPLTISAGTAWCLSMLAGYLCDAEGVDLDAINAGDVHWTDANVVSAANKMLEISKYFQPTAAGDTNDVATANFYNGEAAMLIQGSWAIAQINGSNPEFEDKWFFEVH